jgi:hypothetical protein
MARAQPSSIDSAGLAQRARIARILVNAKQPMTRTDIARYLHSYVNDVKPTIDAMLHQGEVELIGRSINAAKYKLTELGRGIAQFAEGPASRGFDHRALWDALGMDRWIPSCKEIRT